MTSKLDQVHDKFKVFAGKLDDDGTMGALAAEVAAWARDAKVAPKSIGVEYIEAAEKLLFSLGYDTDEPAYGIEVWSTHIGKLTGFGEADLAAIGKAMSEAAVKHGNVICHELYVTAKDDLLMVFMSRTAG